MPERPEPRQGDRRDQEEDHGAPALSDAPPRADLAKLKWRARRGMRELDAVLQSFLQHEAATLPPAELARFEQILDLPDPELLAYLTGRDAPRDPDIGRLIERIRSSHRPRA